VTQSGAGWTSTSLQRATPRLGSGSIDMGARRYGPDTGRFLQRDFLSGALGDLALALDPLPQGRYTLAGANPVSFMDWDGHIVLMGTCEAADELLITGQELALSTNQAPSI
jgi:RHS repeat-associated protein